MKAKSLLYTVGVSFLAGAIVGILYAPEEGAETRKKIGKMKQKFTFGHDGALDDFDKTTLREMSTALQEQLNKINEKLEKQG